MAIGDYIESIGGPENLKKEETKSSAFMQGIENRLLGQSDIISSQDTELESKIKEAMGGIEKGQEASAERVESVFEREKGYTKEAGARTLTTARESQRGFATNRALLTQISEDTEKSVRDLEQRKQELLLSGDAAAAEKISNLQIKELEFAQQSKQQAFNNMIAMAGIGMQQKTEERMASQFKQNIAFQKEQMAEVNNRKIADIALEFGLAIEEGETFESIVEKAKPFASKKRQLELKALQAQITKSTQGANQQIQLDERLEEFIVGGESPDQSAELVMAYAKQIGLDLGSSDFIRLQTRAREIYHVRQLEQQLEERELNEQMQSNIKYGGGNGKNYFTGEAGATPGQDPLTGLDLSKVDLTGGFKAPTKVGGESKPEDLGKLDLEGSFFNNLFSE